VYVPNITRVERCNENASRLVFARLSTALPFGAPLSEDSSVSLARPHTPPFTLAVLAVAVAQPLSALAQEAVPERTLPAIEVTDARNSVEAARNQMPDVTADGRIMAGKHTTVVQLDEQPVIINNNLNQVFARVPGLFVSDQQIPSIFNVNYRGLGNPHESEFVAFFENGIPLAADPIGYATIYYLPPSQRIQSVEFIRGGTGLLYGPQLGPAVNFVTRRADPANTGLHYSTEHAGGTDGFYSTFNEASWGDGTWGTYVEFDHRRADGERDNADYGVFGGRFSLAYQAVASTRVGFDFYAYRSDSGEGGRLTQAEFATNPTLTNTPNNRVFIDNYFGALTLDHDWGDYGSTHAKVWGHYMDRFSRRAGVGLAGPTTLDRREFTTFGLDVRHVLPWSMAGDHIATVGYTVFHTEAPRTQFRNPDQTSSAEVIPVFDQQVNVLYNAIFAENAFRFGNATIAPAVRFEHIDYDANESLRQDAQTPFNFDRTVESLLFGIGLSYDLPMQTQLYANVSESYRPPTFDDVVSPNRNFRPGQTDATGSRNYELGFRGAPFIGARFDVALFQIDVSDRIETQSDGINEFRFNSGDSRHRGVEFDIGYDPLARLNNGESLEVFASATFLDAEITSSRNAALVGNTPGFAPEYVGRLGVIYQAQDRLKLSLTSTLVDSQFWQDSNAPRTVRGQTVDAEIPAFQVVDMAAEFRINQDWMVFSGINNIADERYYSRVRNDGIEVAPDRTFYAGVRFSQ
jgi:Fe(3+) dicitrate transport protein